MICGHCKCDLPESEFYIKRDASRPNTKRHTYCKKCYRAAIMRSYHKHRAARLARAHAHRLELKADVLGHYCVGVLRCICCGEPNLGFLSIDHINGGGTRHRKEIAKNGQYGGADFYRWLRDQGYPAGYQVMCYNCNFGRGRNGGICPHKAGA